MAQITSHDAWVIAQNDDDASARLWADPEAFGREIGLRGAELAELVGSVRSAVRHRNEKSGVEAILASAATEFGIPWPFGAISDDEFGGEADHARHIIEHLFSCIALQVSVGASNLAHYRAWATALLAQAVDRAERTDAVHTGIADVIVAARNLLSACDRCAAKSGQHTP